MPHIARQLGHDVAVPRRGTASMKKLSQRPTEVPSRLVTPDRRKVGLVVSSIDGCRDAERPGKVRRTRTVPPLGTLKRSPMSSSIVRQNG